MPSNFSTSSLVVLTMRTSRSLRKKMLSESSSRVGGPGPSSRTGGAAQELFNEVEQELAAFYAEVDHAKATYRNNKAFYSELPVIKKMKLAGAKCLRLFYLDGDDGGWEEFLPTRAQILACRMANASNALPEQFTGALIHLNTSLENPSRLPPAPRRERNWQRNARSVEGGRDLLDESGFEKDKAFDEAKAVGFVR
ncbi:hypothetical protein NCU10766 [Neurospora crassa OR74A]|uniref:Uncharacterized protein n=1 Tax=Neurospora crassa (strain ATCC 24698 / 74-OR23-1A / CBS 708.71 / DSM 1257 / FGSC 987) TaxID=367110 RepID=A7UX04_NEUCR|nr:hypothetical protein NCU10766 [Neurospora crassa OR74A]EDO65031.2 hypothetical protein NCU10766 [Neurospora crassa OR74A]|eukprot:XP_001728122.2 hypothetical protein NCU10766 [Neurospora crassa OR74A]